MSEINCVFYSYRLNLNKTLTYIINTSTHVRKSKCLIKIPYQWFYVSKTTVFSTRTLPPTQIILSKIKYVDLVRSGCKVDGLSWLIMFLHYFTKELQVPVISLSIITGYKSKKDEKVSVNNLILLVYLEILVKDPPDKTDSLSNTCKKIHKNLLKKSFKPRTIKIFVY